MKKYTYPVIAQIVYRYANLFISFVLLTQIFIFILTPQKNWNYLYFVAINLILLYVVNRFYLKNYKYFPYSIEVDSQKIICTNFVLNNRIIEIKISEIDNLTGGIFSQRPSTPIYIHFKGEQIGVSPHLKDYNKFLTLVLSNVRKEVYDNLLKQMQISTTEKITKISERIKKNNSKTKVKSKTKPKNK